MSGATKLMTAGGGGVSLTPASSIASDVTVNVPSVNGTLVSTGSTAQVSQAMLAAGVAGNGPAFSAYKNGGTQTVSSGTFTKITFNVESFDTNNNFTSSTFTPTVAGYYQVNGSYSVEGIGTVTRLMVSIYKNGAELLRNDLNSSGNQLQVSGLVYCNGTTDYLDLYCWISGSGSLGVRGASDGNVYTYFQASMMRAA